MLAAVNWSRAELVNRPPRPRVDKDSYIIIINDAVTPGRTPGSGIGDETHPDPHLLASLI